MTILYFATRCVRLARFENDRTISFIPPDGSFDLMTYGLNTQVFLPDCALELQETSYILEVHCFSCLILMCLRTFYAIQLKPLIWVEAQVEKHSRSRIELTIKARSQFKERRCCVRNKSWLACVTLVPFESHVFFPSSFAAQQQMLKLKFLFLQMPQTQI